MLIKLKVNKDGNFDKEETLPEQFLASGYLCLLCRRWTFGGKCIFYGSLPQEVGGLTPMTKASLGHKMYVPFPQTTA